MAKRSVFRESLKKNFYWKVAMRLSLPKNRFVSSIRRPMVHIPRRTIPYYPTRHVATAAYPFEQEIYLVGKSIIAFVFFYTSLNWFYYKRTREELEDFYASDAKEIKPKKKDDTKK
jgi:hypothetical protein